MNLFALSRDPTSFKLLIHFHVGNLCLINQGLPHVSKDANNYFKTLLPKGLWCRRGWRTHFDKATQQV